MRASQDRRLFVALWPDDEAREALVRARDRWTWSAAARPTPVAHLHATHVLLGAVHSSRTSALIDALPVAFEPFELRLEPPALWSNGIAVPEPAGDWAALSTLRSAIAARTTTLGLADARRFRPHVTLARDAHGSKVPDGGEAVSWHIRDYALIESRGGR